MKADKDKKGKFKEGNKAGNRFTSMNQPSKNGRKPSRFKEIINELDETGESLSLEDFNKVVKSLLTLDKDNLVKIAKGKDTPIAIVIIASAIAGDIENKQLSNLDRLLDRVYGKATQKSEITGKDGNDIGVHLVFAETPLSAKDLEEIKNIQNGNSSTEEDSTDSGIQEA